MVLVTSGAIATGMARLALPERPRSMPEKQAAAAVGQSTLMRHYEAAFKRHGIGVGQVLLTAQDISDRARYLNARNTLRALLRFGVVPIVNENDTVAVEEIKVGDNDNLSALVASLIDADLLVLLTDVDGLYTANPAVDPDARLLDTVEAVTDEITSLAWAGSGTGAVGGMATKLQAAQKAAAAGVPMIIANGRADGVLGRLLRGEAVGTYFAPKADRLGARKRWIAFAVPPQGRLMVDDGAVRALTQDGKSLLPSGVVGVEGDFAAGAVVAVAGQVEGGREFARGSGEFRRARGSAYPRSQDPGDRAAPGVQELRRSDPPRQPGDPLGRAESRHGREDTGGDEGTGRAGGLPGAGPLLHAHEERGAHADGPGPGREDRGHPGRQPLRSRAGPRRRGCHAPSSTGSR